MISNNIPLVDWGAGTMFLGAFLVVAVILVLVVLNLMNSDKNRKENDSSEEAE